MQGACAPLTCPPCTFPNRASAAYVLLFWPGKINILMKMNAAWTRAMKGLMLSLSLGVVAALSSGCGPSEEETAAAKSRPEPETRVKPEEQPYIDAAKPFVEAVAT